MSELDENRQDYILNHLKDQQVFITCCDPNTIHQLKQGALFKFHQGELIEQMILKILKRSKGGSFMYLHLGQDTVVKIVKLLEFLTLRHLPFQKLQENFGKS